MLKFFRHGLTPQVAQPQQVPNVSLTALPHIALRKLIINNVGCADDRVLELVVVNAFVLGSLLLYHTVVVVFEHHALLVVQRALHDAFNFVHSAQVGGDVKVFVEFVAGDRHILLGFSVCTARTTVQSTQGQDISVGELWFVE